MKLFKGVILAFAFIVTGYWGFSTFNSKKMILDENHLEERKTKIEKKVEDQKADYPTMSSQLSFVSTPKKPFKKLDDDKYKALLKSGSFKEAITYISKKSEEHIGGQPSREDFITKLDVMSEYIEFDPSILKRDFDFFVSYYSLNSYDRRENKLAELEELLEKTYKSEAETTRYCMGFFKESGRRSINYSKLASSVMDCAGDDNKRSIVFDYVNFLKESKDENYAMQEYTKLRLMHNELPEYGVVYKND